MEEMKWKDEIYAKDFLERLEPREQASLEKAMILLEIGTGKDRNSILDLPIAVFLKYITNLTDRYGLDPFLEKK